MGRATGAACGVVVGALMRCGTIGNSLWRVEPFGCQVPGRNGHWRTRVLISQGMCVQVAAFFVAGSAVSKPNFLCSGYKVNIFYRDGKVLGICGTVSLPCSSCTPMSCNALGPSCLLCKNSESVISWEMMQEQCETHMRQAPLLWDSDNTNQPLLFPCFCLRQPPPLSIHFDCFTHLNFAQFIHLSVCFVALCLKISFLIKNICSV